MIGWHTGGSFVCRIWHLQIFYAIFHNMLLLIFFDFFLELQEMIPGVYAPLSANGHTLDMHTCNK